jgi:hypothetical protein
MGFIRRRTRRRTMLVAGGLAYAAGKNAQGAAPEGEAEEAPVAPAAPDQDAGIDELANLAKLHDEGALTDEEFATEKAKILGT